MRIVFSAVISGPPRTKKNSSRIIRAGKFPRILPSAAYAEWNASAVLQLRKQFRGAPITENVNCRAIILREKAAGDAVGFYQALADTLEDAGVVLNDRQIVSWDGTRIDKDARNPRVIFNLEVA